LGSPWTRVEESQPLHSDAGNELESMFFAERMVRQPNLYEMLECSQIRRAGPIGLMDARVLGSELYANTQAKLLGNMIPIPKLLNLVEKEVLVLIEKPLELSELLSLTQELNLRDETVLTAVISLIRSGFVILT